MNQPAVPDNLVREACQRPHYRVNLYSPLREVPLYLCVYYVCMYVCGYSNFIGKLNVKRYEDVNGELKEVGNTATFR